MAAEFAWWQQECDRLARRPDGFLYGLRDLQTALIREVAEEPQRRFDPDWRAVEAGHARVWKMLTPEEQALGVLRQGNAVIEGWTTGRWFG